MRRKFSHQKGQAAVEYMILFAAVVAIVLVAFNTGLPRTQQAGNTFYQRTAVGIYGEPNPCGDQVCGPFEDFEKCCRDCNPDGSSTLGGGDQCGF